METKPFMVQCLKFFGLHRGQTALQFVAELRALTQTDRQEICDMLNAAGYPTAQPAAPTPTAA